MVQLVWNKKQIRVIADYARKLASVYDGIIEEMGERNLDSIEGPFGTTLHWFNQASKKIVMAQKPAIDKAMHNAEMIRDNPDYRNTLPAKRTRVKDGRAKTADEVLDVVKERIKEIEAVYPRTKKRRGK